MRRRNWFVWIFSIFVFTFSAAPSLSEESKIILDIPENSPYVDEIIDYARPFYPYLPKIKITISDSEGSSAWCFNKKCTQIDLAIRVFKNPSFQQEPEAHEIHELFHVVEYETHTHQLKRQHDTLVVAFDRYATAAGYHPYNSILFGDEIETSRLFSLIDESNYSGNHPSIYGHPYSNHGEAFASMLTVVRLFPEKFLVELRVLSVREKKAIAELYFASINILLTQNDNLDNLEILLPKHKRLAFILKQYTK